MCIECGKHEAIYWDKSFCLNCYTEVMEGDKDVHLFTGAETKTKD